LRLWLFGMSPTSPWMVPVFLHRSRTTGGSISADRANKGGAQRLLLGEVSERRQRIGLVCGDSSYFSWENSTLVAGLGGVPRFYPKRNISLWSRRRVRTYYLLLSTIPRNWFGGYSKKACGEWTFSSLKRKCLVPLRSGIGGRRKLEVWPQHPACRKPSPHPYAQDKRQCQASLCKGIGIFQGRFAASALSIFQGGGPDPQTAPTPIPVDSNTS